MKIKYLIPVMFLMASISSAGPRFELDAGANIPVIPEQMDAFKCGFVYDVEFGFPIYSDLGIFTKWSQTFGGETTEENSVNYNYNFSQIAFGVDYSFRLTQNDFLRPAVFIGYNKLSISKLGDDSLDGGALCFGASVFYVRQLTEHLQLNGGIDFTYRENYYPLGIKAGVSYIW